ncbi:MAG: winged helix-turn-helix transcriptional regulator [Leucobacter sp.]
MITTPRSDCPVNRALEVIGDQWSLVILRDIAAYDRRSFRDLRASNGEGISAPVLSRRLTDLTQAGFLTKADASRGKQGKYSLTELGLQTIPLMAELARLGVLLDASTAQHAPDFVHPANGDGMEAEINELRLRHLDC